MMNNHEVIKICFLTSNLDVKSGWGRYSFEIVSRMEKLNFLECKVLVEHGCGTNNEYAVLPKNNENVLSFSRSIFIVRQFIKNCDIIHCLDGWPYGVIAALANIGLGKKIIINGVGTFSVAPLYQPFKKILLAWVYKKADHILCISRFTLNEIAKKVKLDNLSVVNLGVDFARFSVDSKAISKDETKIILSVGAIKSRKGFHISIPAVAEAVKKYPNLMYYIVGSQSDKKYFNLLNQLVNDLKIHSNVILVDSMPDEKLLGLYHRSNLFLLTPVNIGHNFEGFGLVYLEAGACGKPVIGTTNCGAEDAIVDGVTGLLVPQNNIKKTAEAIMKIFADIQLADKMGNNGRVRAINMDWNTVVDKYVGVYEKIL